MLLAPLLLIGTSCTIDESPPQVNPAKINPAVTGNTTAPAMLDIKFFTAKPKTIRPGESTILAWNVDGVSSLSIDPAIGSVTGNTGNVTISPRETTLYTLKASDGHNEISSRFLVIVKTADGTVVWPNSGSDNTTPEQLYEGWSFYPNQYVEWSVTDRYRDQYSDTGFCWYIGFITNNHPKWMMTEVTVSSKLVLKNILPGSKEGYTVSSDCLQLPDLKWKWKPYQ